MRLKITFSFRPQYRRSPRTLSFVFGVERAVRTRSIVSFRVCRRRVVDATHRLPRSRRRGKGREPVRARGVPLTSRSGRQRNRRVVSAFALLHTSRARLSVGGQTRTHAERGSARIRPARRRDCAAGNERKTFPGGREIKAQHEETARRRRVIGGKARPSFGRRGAHVAIAIVTMISRTRKDCARPKDGSSGSARERTQSTDRPNGN